MRRFRSGALFCAISAGLRTFSGFYAQIRQFLLAHFWAGVMCRSVRLFCSRRYDASCRCPAHSFRIGLHFGGAVSPPVFSRTSAAPVRQSLIFSRVCRFCARNLRHYTPRAARHSKLNRALRTVNGLPRPIISACPAHVSPPLAAPLRHAQKR